VPQVKETGLSFSSYIFLLRLQTPVALSEKRFGHYLMGDPVSVTGSAVGIVSLGLTLCQGLLAFYGPYKAYDEETRSIAGKVQGLKTVLETLQELVIDLEASGAFQSGSYATVLQNNIIACEKALQSLDDILAKCTATSPPGRLNKENWFQKNRVLYPFRRETLKALKDTVNGLQANLDTAVQVFQVCAYISLVDLKTFTNTDMLVIQ
jgi:Fungal N-terminal domain of STAND proteins